MNGVIDTIDFTKLDEQAQADASYIDTSVSHGTHRLTDLYDAFSGVLGEIDPQALHEIRTQYKDVLGAIGDAMMSAKLEDAWANWDTVASEYLHAHPDAETEFSEMINEAFFNALDKVAPEGCYFGAHPGDGSDFGFWSNEYLEWEASDETLEDIDQEAFGAQTSAQENNTDAGDASGFVPVSKASQPQAPKSLLESAFDETDSHRGVYDWDAEEREWDAGSIEGLSVTTSGTIGNDGNGLKQIHDIRGSAVIFGSNRWIEIEYAKKRGTDEEAACFDYCGVRHYMDDFAPISGGGKAMEGFDAMSRVSASTATLIIMGKDEQGKDAVKAFTLTLMDDNEVKTLRLQMGSGKEAQID